MIPSPKSMLVCWDGFANWRQNGSGFFSILFIPCSCYFQPSSSTVEPDGTSHTQCGTEAPTEADNSEPEKALQTSMQPADDNPFKYPHFSHVKSIEGLTLVDCDDRDCTCKLKKHCPLCPLSVSLRSSFKQESRHLALCHWNNRFKYKGTEIIMQCGMCLNAQVAILSSLDWHSTS